MHLASRRVRGSLALHYRSCSSSRAGATSSVGFIVPWRRARDRCRFGPLMPIRQFLVPDVQPMQFVFRQLIDRDASVARALSGGDQRVELQVRRHAAFVLRALNKKHHHKRDDVRHGIDYKLPGVRVVEQRSRDCPRHDDGHRQQKRPRTAGPRADACRDAFEECRFIVASRGHMRLAVHERTVQALHHTRRTACGRDACDGSSVIHSVAIPNPSLVGRDDDGDRNSRP
jgi:hypothetical protein